MGARKLVNVVLSGLPGELQDIREQQDLTLEVVCNPLKWQQSKLSRMENGQQCISDVDLGALCAAYGVTGEERRHLLRMAERQDDPGYWETDSPMAEESRTLKRLERAMTAVVDVAAWLIPELVQTGEYASAVMESDGMSPDHITARANERQARQIFAKENAPKLDLIVGETALRCPIGGNDVMTRQLRFLLEIAQRRDVRLRIVPLTTGGDAGMHDAFSVMEFPRKKSVVYVQHPTSGLFLERHDMIEVYRRRVARLATVALEPAESMDLIATIAQEFESPGAMNGAGAGLRTRAAGVPRIRLHDVRHTYATLSLDSGIDPKVVSDRIGHSNMAYTLQIYTHRSTGKDKPAAEKVAGIIFGDGWQAPPTPTD